MKLLVTVTLLLFVIFATAVPSCCTNCGGPVTSVLEDIDTLSNLLEDPTALDNLDNDEDFTNTLATPVRISGSSLKTIMTAHPPLASISQYYRAEWFNTCHNKKVCSVPCCDGLVYAEFKSDMSKYFPIYAEKCTDKTQSDVEQFVLEQVATRYGPPQPTAHVTKAPHSLSGQTKKFSTKTLGMMMPGLPGGKPGQIGLPMGGKQPVMPQTGVKTPSGFGVPGKTPSGTTGSGGPVGGSGGGFGIINVGPGQWSGIRDLPLIRFKTLPVFLQDKLREYITRHLVEFIREVKRLCTQEQSGREPSQVLLELFQTNSAEMATSERESSYFPVLKDFFATLLERVADIYATPCPCSRLTKYISSDDIDRITPLLKADCLKQNCNMKEFGLKK